MGLDLVAVRRENNPSFDYIKQEDTSQFQQDNHTTSPNISRRRTTTWESTNQSSTQRRNDIAMITLLSSNNPRIVTNALIQAGYSGEEIKNELKRMGLSTKGLGKILGEEKTRVEKNNKRADNAGTVLDVCSIFTPTVPLNKLSKFKKLKGWYMKGSENDEAWKKLSPKNKFFHELGQGTYSNEVFEKYKDMSPVERGKAIWGDKDVNILRDSKINKAFSYGGDDYNKGLLQTGPTSAGRDIGNKTAIGGTLYGLYEYIDPED